MVQRKVQSKLGIQSQADDIKPGRKLVSGAITNLKTPSPQHPDGKNRGADLKIKMKKSGSIKRSSLDGLKSSTFRKEIPQPGKPPPLNVPVQKPQVRSSSDGSLPNYMRSTSSSDARKELSPVRRRRSSTGSKMNSPDTETSAKALRRSSSSKLVRTLTKTPSFKPARSSLSVSAKKCSKAVLCANMNSQRATCSSTLKDSKFPEYLTLSPGATEGEGTSAMKVCPYTYCSLNGHRHAPLPPLKCFISARRRAIKTQKSFKVEALSPRRRLNDNITEIDVGEVERCLDEEMDFFVEIYTKGEDNKDLSRSIDQCTNDEAIVPAAETGDESLDGLVNNEKIGVEENQEGNYCAGGEEEEAKDLSEVSTFIMDPEGKLEDEECQESIEVLNDAGSELADNMEWDETQSATSELDGEMDYSMEKEDGSEMKNSDACFNLFIINLNVHVYNGMAKDETDAHSEAQCDEDHVSEISESRLSDCLSYDEFSEDEAEEATVEAEGIQEGLTKEETEENKEADVAEAEAENVEINMVLQDTAEEEDQVDENPQENQDDSSDTAGFSLEQEVLIADDGNEIIEGTEQSTDADLLGQVQITPSHEEVIPSLDNINEHIVEDVDGLSHKQSEITNDEIESDQIEKVSDGTSKLDNLEEEITMESSSSSSISEESSKGNDSTALKMKSSYSRASISSQELPDPSKNWIGKNRCRTLAEEEEDQRKFNPRDPNYLPLVPDPEGEKVDLKHQMMDERKNSEEWMIDYALQRVVSKLAPARKRKVALLVEAFERVGPTHKWDTHLMSPTAIQACS